MEARPTRDLKDVISLFDILVVGHEHNFWIAFMEYMLDQILC